MNEKESKKINSAILTAALDAARAAATADEVPVGAVIFNSDTLEIVSVAHNRTEQDADPTAHAEVLAIQKACHTLGVKRLVGYSLFVTLEPCAMCAGAISWARLDAVYFGANDPKTGAIYQGCQTFTHPQTHHKPTVESGFEADMCAQLMIDFFKSKRK